MIVKYELPDGQGFVLETPPKGKLVVPKGKLVVPK